jgi:hypothetical protein
MSDLKFSCPHCQQHIEAESGYAGIQINCPSCQGALIVPGTPLPAPPPPPPAPPRLQVPRQPAAATAATSSCPSCGNALLPGAVLCINCGFNLTTGKRMVAGQVMASGRPAETQWETPWYKTALPYVGALVLLLGVLYLLGRQNRSYMFAFLLTAGLYSGVVHIVVIVAAFQEGMGTGFLTLCVPFFSLYFVFKTNDSDTLRVLYAVAVVLNLAVRFIPQP